MAQRERTKAKRTTARPEESSSGTGDTVQRLEARARALELERDSLKTELEAAKARMKTLETARDQVVSKIDGMLNSLNAVVGKD